ncbi:MAG TPA: NAD(P)/FAD-dependent oxidoreductase, partial [Kofleriaceae bacterium]|nr:NAD(P)/FAD-dependent oxidoreductase [Kofleriaceae bacterium]
STTSRWTIDIAGGEQMTCSFLHLCSGYYDYDAGYTPDFPGAAEFQGRVVHPQQWSDDVDYANKRVVVIGSGATAVTLVPELAKHAAHVTMLQRSPTYIMSVPAMDPIAKKLRARLSEQRAYSATRWKNVLLSMAFYQWCRRFPGHAKRVLVNQVRKALGDHALVAEHFTPTYKPWDQRLCFVPDGDMFEAIKAGRASVVTDHIETFTPTGIRLRSGAELPADLVVTATGLRLRVFGKIAIEVDGEPIDPGKTMVYRGMMCSDIPNFAFSVGYTNASWTLKCDLTSRFVCRLINHMDAQGYTKVWPKRDPRVEEQPLIDFSSGYVLRAVRDLPKQGSIVPWKLYQNYALDVMMIDRGRLDDGILQWATSAARSTSPSTARASRQP